MAVVMSGSFAFLLNQYNLVQRAADLVTADLTEPVAREGDDRGSYVRQENGPGINSKPLFVQVNRDDPNNPTYKLVDETGQTPPPIEDLNGNGLLDLGEDINANGVLDQDQYIIDNNGNILFTPMTQTVPGPGSWFVGTFNGTSRNVNFTSDSYIWHPYPTTPEDLNSDGQLNPGEDVNHNQLLDTGKEQVYFGRSFVLDKVEPKEGQTVRGGTIYIAADNNARVWVNGTYVGVANTYTPPTEIVVSPSLLKVGENVITVQASNSGGPAGISVVADFGGVDGKGAGYGGVTLTTKSNEIDRWSTSFRATSGLLGKVQFDIRQGSALNTRTDQVSRLQGVMASLTALLGSTVDHDATNFQALR